MEQNIGSGEQSNKKCWAPFTFGDEQQLEAPFLVGFEVLIALIYRVSSSPGFRIRCFFFLDQDLGFKFLWIRIQF